MHGAGAPRQCREYFFYIKGFNRSSSPLVLMTCMVESSMPSFPGGNPSRSNHSRYDTGNRAILQPLYLPKGISVVTSSRRIFGSGVMQCL